MGSFGPLNRNKFNININMSKFLQRILVILTVVMLPMTILADGYQLPDPSFEDWSGTAFDGKIQPKYWHASNVEQSALGMSFKFNFAIQSEGHTGKYCIVAQDQVVGAAGITETISMCCITHGRRPPRVLRIRTNRDLVPRRP